MQRRDEGDQVVLALEIRRVQKIARCRGDPVLEAVLGDKLPGHGHDVRMILHGDAYIRMALAGRDGVTAGPAGEVEPMAEAGEIEPLGQPMRQRDGRIVAGGGEGPGPFGIVQVAVIKLRRRRRRADIAQIVGEALPFVIFRRDREAQIIAEKGRLFAHQEALDIRQIEISPIHLADQIQRLADDQQAVGRLRIDFAIGGDLRRRAGARRQSAEHVAFQRGRERLALLEGEGEFVQPLRILAFRRVVGDRRHAFVLPMVGGLPPGAGAGARSGVAAAVAGKPI